MIQSDERFSFEVLCQDDEDVGEPLAGAEEAPGLDGDTETSGKTMK